jgi:hypothetical protein
MRAMIIKKMLLGIILITAVGYVCIPSVKMKDQTGTMNIYGSLIESGENYTDSAEITLFEKVSEEEWKKISTVVSIDQEFVFTLDLNKYYQLEVSKKNFVKRYMMISTHLTEKKTEMSGFECFVQLDLFRTQGSEAEEHFNYPVDLVGFNPNSGRFESKYSFIMPRTLLDNELSQVVDLPSDISKD